MLLEFRIKNYKSFVEEVKFSMLAAPKQKGLDYSLCIEKIKGKVCKGLSSSVIYGPNAAGKTNIVGAMDVLRSIVLQGNIRNSEEKSSPNPASAALELIPNNKYVEPQPVEFAIEFVENGLKIGYSVSLDLGVFLDSEYQRKILKEKLLVNGELIFNRGEKLQVGNLKEIKTYMADSIYKKADGLIEIAKNSLNQEELFLTNGFKLIYSQAFVKVVTDWFMNKFMIMYRADFMQLIKRFVDPQKKAVYVEKTTDKAAKLFGINSTF